MDKAFRNEYSVSRNVCLRDFTMLRAGGPAESFAIADAIDDLAGLASQGQVEGRSLTVIGSGSNILPSDAGVPGLVLLNRTRRVKIARDGNVLCDTGVALQELFLKSAQCGLGGLEFGVGIPGSVGGALASNAGAYRSSIGDLVTELEIVQDGVRSWVPPTHLEFSYRDSLLRRSGGPSCVVLRIRLKLPVRPQKSIYDEAREYQRQRISKQPAPASAGSFFKNVLDRSLADCVPGLTAGMRESGVVPAGFLIEACGLKGYRMGGAMLGARHANFILNVGAASATNIRDLAEYAKRMVKVQFAVDIEEEVLYLGDWSRYAG